jgi:uncharacterized protein YciI
MQKNALFLLSFAFVVTSCAQSLRSGRATVAEAAAIDSGTPNLKPLYWLADDWVLLRNGQASQSYESWQYVNDSLFQATSFTLRPNGDTLVTETIDLTVQNGAIHYIPTVKGQNDNKPVPFRLAEQEGVSWVFENPDHDFPKRIRYALVGHDTLHAQISGSGKEINFAFLRKPRIQRFEIPGEDGPVVMRKFWLLSYLSGPNRSQSKEEAAQIQSGHMGHLSAIYHAGKSCVAGPTDGDGEVRGFVVYTTGTRQEAAYLATLDPAVKAGRLTFRLESWWAMEGAVLK